MRVYAQVIYGIVNLVGGTEVGLPYNDEIVTSVDVTDIPENDRPREGWYYSNGTFSEIGEPTPLPKTKLELLQEQLQATQEAVDFLLMGGM